MTMEQHVKIGNPIGNLYRKNHTLILLKRNNGGFILGKKQGFYPDHIARFIGGGIKNDEAPVLAALREVQEETGITITEDKLVPLLAVETTADTNEGPMDMLTHIFAAEIPADAKVVASDDVTGTVEITLDELRKLIEDMNNLTGIYTTPDFSFEWADWGKIYGPIHQLSLERYISIDSHF
jgi:8-oxo-dGTP pyrophosphatase MutT (NUDIX family)